MNYKMVYKNITEELFRYIKNHNLKCAVVGMSGGIDSTLTAALAYKAGINVIGRSITIDSNKEPEILRGNMAGEMFCNTEFISVNFTKQYEDLKSIMIDNETNLDGTQSEKYKIRCGNIKARLRMMYLYDIAQRYGGCVLSTDNFTELMLGFWTLHGDVGDLGMIQKLTKTEVYGLAKWMVENVLEGGEIQAMQLAIDAIPTDGLGVTNSDLDQLEADSYEQVDEILVANWINGEYEDHPVIQRQKRTVYKRNNPYNFERKLLTKGIKDKFSDYIN